MAEQGPAHLIRLIPAFSLFCLFFLFSSVLQAMTITRDIEYAASDGSPLLLDLYLPDTSENPYLIVWLHGGIWQFGGKEDVNIADIVEHGFALASIGFTNAPEKTFPAQLHEIKAAIRFLRANAGRLGYRADKIAVWGYSSEPHLAALTGATNGNAILEGTLGEYLDVSSDVQAVIDYSGPTNLNTILHQSTEHGVSVRAPGMEKLLGKPVDDPAIQEMVALASPVMQVDAGDPPLMIMHGIQDNQVPINQSLELEAVYRKFGLTVETVWIPEAEHTSGEYFHSPYLDQAADFLRRVLRDD